MDRAEYGMLPRATHTRVTREAASGKQAAALWKFSVCAWRCVRVDLENASGEFTITLDCDVIRADGAGTRTASITGACVALADALNKLVANGKLKPIR